MTMVNLSRRSFLGGSLALVAATAIPASASAFATVPTIYADGVHDDTAGLNALFAGEPYRVAPGAPCVVRSDGGTVYLGDGHYRLSDTLRIRRSATVSRVHLEASDNFPPDAAMIHIEGEHTVARFDGLHARSRAWSTV